MLCPDCYSSEFRLSRFRLRDLRQLAVLKYPIRCKNCKMRIHTTFRQAVRLSRRHPESSAQVSSHKSG